MIGVVVAAIAAFAFGAVWYMSMAKQWIAAAGVPVGPDGRPMGGGSAMPFVIGFVAMILVAGMMRHVFVMGGIETLGKGLLSGLGIGAFIVTPWVAMNYAFAMRPAKLTLIDGVNSVVGCAIIGAVLGAFGL